MLMLMILTITPSDKPGVPEGPLKATEVGPNAITVAWKPPKDDGGAKIEKYVLEKRPKGSQRWQKVPGMISPRDTEATAKNLDQGQEYDFRVMAVNEHGESDPLVTEEAIKAKHPFGETCVFCHRLFCDIDIWLCHPKSF